MTRRQIFGWLALGSGALAMTRCTQLFPNTFRFKMTVEVETPQGLKTGSSVMEMAAGEPLIKLVGTGAGVNFKGEAVPVDLPGGQTMFALIGNTPRANPFDALVIDTFDPSFPREERLIALAGELGRKSSIGRSVDIAPQNYPTLVRFRDIRDPKTVELVDPNDLAKSFGTGVKLRRIVLTIVDAPVRVGVEKRLVWLGEHAEPSLVPIPSGGTTMPSAGQRIHHGDFRKGTLK